MTHRYVKMYEILCPRRASPGEKCIDTVDCPECGAPRGYFCAFLPLGRKSDEYRFVPHPQRYAVGRAKAALLGKPLKRARY